MAPQSSVEKGRSEGKKWKVFRRKEDQKEKSGRFLGERKIRRKKVRVKNVNQKETGSESKIGNKKKSRNNIAKKIQQPVCVSENSSLASVHHHSLSSHHESTSGESTNVRKVVATKPRKAFRRKEDQKEKSGVKNVNQKETGSESKIGNKKNSQNNIAKKVQQPMCVSENSSPISVLDLHHHSLSPHHESTSATDIAGEVVEVGSGVTKFKAGDKVVAVLIHFYRLNIDDFEANDEVRPDFPCSYCYEDFDIASVFHLADDHSCESKVSCSP
ncbi:unnamed protein product [Camellia sinensis]